MEIKTDAAEITEQKRLDLTLTFPNGANKTLTIREENGDNWTLKQGILQVKLFAKKEDREPSEEHTFFGGHLAGLSYHYYTQRVKVTKTTPAVDNLVAPTKMEFF